MASLFSFKMKIDQAPGMKAFHQRIQGTDLLLYREGELTPSKGESDTPLFNMFHEDNYYGVSSIGNCFIGSNPARESKNN